VTVRIPKKVFEGTGKPLTLCQEGYFPLKAPKCDKKARCVPQEGIVVE
jgi:hypothetical protein